MFLFEFDCGMVFCWQGWPIGGHGGNSFVGLLGLVVRVLLSGFDCWVGAIEGGIGVYWLMGVIRSFARRLA